jgi:hypothetical protein
MQYPDMIDMLGLSNDGNIDNYECFILQDKDLPRSQWIRKSGNKWYIYSKRTHKKIGRHSGYSSRAEAKSAFNRMMRAKWGSK